jgi:nicotinamidase-related amidase
MSTEGCVAQTTVDARELGFKVTVLAGACGTIDGRV